MKTTLSLSAVKDESNYTWYTYQGPTFFLPRKNKEEVLKSGEVFGIRPSANGKAIRAVLQRLGTSIVFTIDPETQAYLVKKSKATDGKKVAKDVQSAEDLKRDSKAVLDALKKNMPNFTFDMGLVKKLRRVASVLDKIYEKGAFHLLPKVVTALEAKYDKEPVKPKTKNAGAARAASAVLNGSVPKIYKGASGWISDNRIEPDMVALHLNDCADHLELACALYTYDGTTKAAKKVDQLSDMDTASREEIPSSAWSWIVKLSS